MYQYCLGLTSIASKWRNLASEDDLKTFWTSCGCVLLPFDFIFRNNPDLLTFTDVIWRGGWVQPLCEGWWNRSDISPGLKREIPAGTGQRGGWGRRGVELREVRPLRGSLILQSSAPYTHSCTHTKTLSVCRMMHSCKEGWVPQE